MGSFCKNPSHTRLSLPVRSPVWKRHHPGMTSDLTRRQFTRAGAGAPLAALLPQGVFANTSAPVRYGPSRSRGERAPPSLTTAPRSAARRSAW
jgi:hypothetical protein